MSNSDHSVRNDVKSLIYSKEADGYGNGSFNFGKLVPVGSSSDEKTYVDLNVVKKTLKYTAEAVKSLDGESSGSGGHGNAPTERRRSAIQSGQLNGVGSGSFNFGKIEYVKDAPAKDVKEKTRPVKNVQPLKKILENIKP